MRYRLELLDRHVRLLDTRDNTVLATNPNRDEDRVVLANMVKVLNHSWKNLQEQQARVDNALNHAWELIDEINQRIDDLEDMME